MADGSVGTVGADLADVAPLLRELVFIKRVRSAGHNGSLSERLFLGAWAALVHGASLREVAHHVIGAALAAARLGDLDAATLGPLGVPPGPVLRAAIAGFAPVLDEALLRDVTAAVDEVRAPHAPPDFARALADQPRAGITCPGLPRVASVFVESHADHSLAVAVGGAVLAHRFGADVEEVFLTGLQHHLHNAAMPDSGFVGETLLGAHLGPAMTRARDTALAELPPSLAGRCRALQNEIATDATPLARAFHAADVLDRVLEIEACLASARLTMDDVLGRYALVHAGPVKPFHDRVLARAGVVACD